MVFSLNGDKHISYFAAVTHAPPFKMHLFLFGIFFNCPARLVII